MIGKKINQLATELAPVSTDLTIIGDPTTGVSKKITLAQLGAIFSGAVSFYTNLAAFPTPGTIDVIYCAKDTQKLYLWSGSAYVEVFPSQALLNTYQLRSEKGNANGYASLDSGGKVPISQLPSSIMEYKGTWNAATNTPTLANGTGDTGDVYLCNVAGSVNFGAGVIVFAVGDYVIYSGTIWQRSSGAVGTVTSVGITETGDALTITGSPITTSGTINIGFAGANTQYVRGDGTLATFPSIISQAQNLVTEVYNSTGATLTKGTVVYINGGQGNLPTITKALATGDSTSAQTYGIVQNDITNNNNGFVVAAGRLSDLDTQAFTEGTQLYLSSTTAGAYTSTKQYAPAHLVYVAIVVRAHPTQGVIEVKIQNGFEMDELHNVSAQSPSNNDGLFYNTSTSLWEKKSIATVLGYTPANAATYVPYTGATTSVNLGTNNITAQNNILNGNGTDTGSYLAFKQYSGSNSGADGYTSLYALAQNSLYIRYSQTDLSQKNVDLSAALLGTTTRQYLFPDKNGTFAMLSDIPALTGYVTGSGVNNYIAKFTSTGSVIGNSQIIDNGTSILIGASGSVPNVKVVINSTTQRALEVVSTNTDALFVQSPAAFIMSISNGTWYTNFTNTGRLDLAGDLLINTIANATTDTNKFLVSDNGVVKYRTGTEFLSDIGGPYVSSVAALTIGTTGTDLSSTVANSTTTPVITLNVPTASATNRGALSSADWTTFNNKTSNTGTVTSVGLSSATSGVTIGSTPITTSGTITLAIATASGSQQGLLSSTDWTTFNSKQNTLTNPVTGTGTTNYLPKFTGASTIGNSNVQDDGTTVTITSNTAGNSTLNLISSNSVNSGKIQFGGATFGATIEKNSLGADSGLIFNSYHGGAEGYTFQSNGTNVMKLSASGNLGLGVTPSAWGTIKAYQVFNGSFSGSPNNNIVYQFGNTFYDGASFNYIASDFAAQYRLNNSGGHAWYTAPSGTAGNAISFTQAMTLNASGNLSIGNTNDTYKLDVTGTGRFTGTINGKDNGLVTRNTASGGTTEVYDLRFNTGATLYYGIESSVGGTLATGTSAYSVVFGNVNARSVHFYTNNIVRQTIDASGNLGLGVTPSAWGSTNKVFETTLGTSLIGRSDFSAFGRNFYYNSSDAAIYTNTGNATGYFQAAGQHFWVNAPSGTAGNAISFTQAMTLNASGVLLVGTTSSPSASTVKNVIMGASSSDAYYQFTNGSGGGGIIGSNSGAGINFYTFTGAVGSETYSHRMLINSSGNVGIGTTSPSAKLDVFGGAIRTSFSSGNAFLEFYSGGSAGYIEQKNANSLITIVNGAEAMRIKSTGVINLSNVPTSSAGLSSGDIYKSAGVLMIV